MFHALVAKLDMDEECHVDSLNEIEEYNKMDVDCFKSDFKKLVILVKPFRLHASTLIKAISLSPEKKIMKETTVTLQHYLGNVLCTYFLKGHSTSGMVEG